MKIFTSILFSLFFAGNAFADWKFETIEGVQVHYYVPKATGATSKALMINLHGCSQKAEDLKKDGNWENTAENFNMIVALPKVPNGGVIAGCWDYYGADHTVNNRHNAPVIKLVQALLKKADLGIDPDQVYLSGLSSGGGETMVLGCLAPEIFAGIGINAGPSTGTTSAEISRPRTSYETMLATCKKLGAGKEESFKTQLTSIIYGNNDFIVSTAFNTNNAEIMRTIYGANTKSTFDTKKLEGANTEGVGTMWSDEIGPRVSLIMNTNLGHNWPAGQGGNNGSFINKKSINYPSYLAHFFFVNNRRSKSIQLPEVMIDPIDSQESKFIISGSVRTLSGPIKTIDVVVRRKRDNEAVDQFTVEVKTDGSFTGLSKALADGEYSFDFEVKNIAGILRTFKRSSWLGEIVGINTPQLIGTQFQSVQGCLILAGLAVNNGGDKVVSVNAYINAVDKFVTTITNTKWSFKICDIPAGKHVVDVFAENESGLASNPLSFKFLSSLDSATSTLQDHMESKRLSWEEYGEWYLKYGHEYFTLYLGNDGIWREK